MKELHYKEYRLKWKKYNIKSTAHCFHLSKNHLVDNRNVRILLILSLTREPKIKIQENSKI